MKTLLTITFAFITALLLSSCGTQMATVMQQCDTGNNTANFSNYSYCIKQTYSTRGSKPNSPEVRALYAYLDQIDEAYRAKQMTNAQARAAAQTAFLNTVQASNNRNQATFCRVYAGTLICN
jgi:hypothetical protein